MKYLLSNVEFKKFEKGTNIGREYVLAEVSNYELDVDTKTTHVALLLPPVAIEKWKQLVANKADIIRDGQFFTVNDLPNFYKFRFGTKELICDANGTPIIYNSLQVFSFLGFDETTGKKFPLTNVRDSAMRMIASLFQLAAVGATEHVVIQAPAPDETTGFVDNDPSHVYPPNCDTDAKKASYKSAMGW